MSHVDTSGYAGTFQLTFQNGEHVTGSFDAATCPKPSSNGITICAS